jgi:hypothetical protein
MLAGSTCIIKADYTQVGLTWVPLKVEPEKKSWGLVACVGGKPGKQEFGSGEVRWKEGKANIGIIRVAAWFCWTLLKSIQKMFLDLYILKKEVRVSVHWVLFPL